MRAAWGYQRFSREIAGGCWARVQAENWGKLNLPFVDTHFSEVFRQVPLRVDRRRHLHFAVMRVNDRLGQVVLVFEDRIRIWIIICYLVDAKHLLSRYLNLVVETSFQAQNRLLENWNGPEHWLCDLRLWVWYLWDNIEIAKRIWMDCRTLIHWNAN